ncbi:MAG: hypothetical protein WC700_16870 [Gemmatimonadaceae bacterium]|jgi:hypothetical protein
MAGEVQVTELGVLAELAGSGVRVTELGVLAEIGPTGIYVTVVGVLVEIEYVAPPTDLLDASLVKFLRVQAGKQAAFDTPATPTFALPVKFVYVDGDEEQVAAWDGGVWTPSVIVERTAQFATFTLRGALFFELLPVLFNAGFADMAPSGAGPYSYAASVLPTAPGTPLPYTFRFGGNDSNRNLASMVQVQDAYLRTMALTFNMNDKEILCESEWFGRWVDDNDGFGYAPEAVTLPPGLALVQGLRSTWAVQDAGVAGGAFDALTPFECSLMDWTLTLDTGLRPAWAGDGNALTYCGARHEWPGAALQAHLRTNLTNYAVTKVYANLRTFQELQVAFYGDAGRQAIFNMTGRWLPRFHAHDRSREEVVMKPSFQVATPHEQVTTPHWLSWQFDTRWQHGEPAGGPLFHFVDDFTTPEAAPLADPRTAEPGPGTSTFLNGAAATSIVGGELVMGNDAYLNVTEPLTRVAGQGVFVEMTFAAVGGGVGMEVGFDQGTFDSYLLIGNATPRLTAQDYNTGFDPNGTDNRLTAVALAAGDHYQAGIIRRGAGAPEGGNLHVIKGASFTEWTLFYAGIVDTIATDQYAFIESPNGGDNVATWRVATLGAPFDGYYGLADQTLMGVQTPGQVFTHAADCHFEFTVVTRPTADELQVNFRMSGNSGYRVGISGSDNELRLYRLDGGSPTTLATSATTIVNGHRIHVTMVGNQIVVYRPGQRLVFATSADYPTQTDGAYVAAGTDGVVSNLIVWPWTLGAAAAAMLDEVFA